MMPSNGESDKAIRSQFNVLWICDCSSSMKGKGKAGSMNTIIREIVQELADIPNEITKSDIFVRAICYSDKSEWVNPSFVPVQEFQWHDLQPGGASNLGDALTEIDRDFKAKTVAKGDKLLSILISDGYPTDDWEKPLAIMKNNLEPWDPIFCAVRIQDTDDEVVMEFAGIGEDLNIRIMETDNIENIIHIVQASILNEG